MFLHKLFYLLISNMKSTPVPCTWKSTMSINVSFHYLIPRCAGTMRDFYFTTTKSIMSSKYLVMGSVHCHSLNLNLQFSGCQGTARTSSQMTSWRWLVLSPFKHLGHLERAGRVGWQRREADHGILFFFFLRITLKLFCVACTSTNWWKWGGWPETYSMSKEI